MNLEFSDEETQTDYPLSLFDSIHYVLKPMAKQNPDFHEPVLSNYFSPFASLEKVKNGLRDICILLQTYLLPCIEGDFSWAEKYKEQRKI